MSLFLNNPVQPSLKVPADALVWQRCAPRLASVDDATRWRLYLHELVWAALLPWFQSEFEQTPTLWPTENTWPLWQVVEGIVLTFDGGAGERRIVVMPSEAIDATELRVPKEWVDIDAWAGDYFVAAQVDVDEQQVTLWGYTTRSQLKANSTYNATERSYCLGEAALIQDFSAFWVAQQLEAVTTAANQTANYEAANEAASEAASETLKQADNTENTDISTARSANLLRRLAQVPEPRLEIPFSLWRVLISDAQWRQQLYQQRLSQHPQDNGRAAPKQNRLVNLGDWIGASSRQVADQVNQQIAEAGWQILDAFVPQTPATNFRGIPLSTVDVPSDAQSVGSTSAGATYGKRFVLRTTADAFSLVLVVSVSVEADQRRSIRIQLYPAGKSAPASAESASSNGLPSAVFSASAFSAGVFSPNLCLPAELTLSLTVPGAAEPLRTIQTGDRDNYIQLPVFRCPADRAFTVRIQQEDGITTFDCVS